MKYYFIYSSTIKGRKKVTKISISYFLLNPSTKSKPRYNRLLLEMKKRCRQSWASFDTVFFFPSYFSHIHVQKIADRQTKCGVKYCRRLVKRKSTSISCFFRTRIFSSKEVLLFRLRISLWYKNKREGLE